MWYPRNYKTFFHKHKVIANISSKQYFQVGISEISRFKMRKVKFQLQAVKNPGLPIPKGSYLRLLDSPEEQAEKLSIGDSKAMARAM